MADLKTKATEASVTDFLDNVTSEDRRADCQRVLELMKEITGEQPKMWGPSMIGFGRYHYRYESGREGDWFLTGFSPRKANLTLYIMAGFERYDGLMGRLGKYKTGKSCLYLKRLSDVEEPVLRELIDESVKHMRRTHETS